MIISISIQKAVEIDDKLFVKAAREEYKETVKALKESGEESRGAFITLDDVFTRMYNNGQILLEIESEDIEVWDGLQDVDSKTGKLI